MLVGRPSCIPDLLWHKPLRWRFMQAAKTLLPCSRLVRAHLVSDRSLVHGAPRSSTTPLRWAPQRGCLDMGRPTHPRSFTRFCVQILRLAVVIGRARYEGDHG